MVRTVLVSIIQKAEFVTDVRFCVDVILSDQDSLRCYSYMSDECMTYLLLIRTTRTVCRMLFINLKEAGFLENPDHIACGYRKTLWARSMNLLIIYSLWFLDIYARNRSIASTIILAKILLIIFLLQGLAIFYLEPLWNREYIEEVQIFATETLGCEGRAQYYETAGVVRDMLQNHMLQILALVAMEPPCKNGCQRTS